MGRTEMVYCNVMQHVASLHVCLQRAFFLLLFIYVTIIVHDGGFDV